MGEEQDDQQISVEEVEAIANAVFENHNFAQCSCNSTTFFLCVDEDDELYSICPNCGRKNYDAKFAWDPKEDE